MKHETHFARFSEILTETDLQQTTTRNLRNGHGRANDPYPPTDLQQTTTRNLRNGHGRSPHRTPHPIQLAFPYTCAL